MSLILSLSIPTLFPVTAQQSAMVQNTRPRPIAQSARLTAMLPKGAEPLRAIALLQEGKKYYDAGQFTQATRTLQQATKISQAAGDILKQVQALSFTSLAQQKLGQWQEAEAAINTSFNLLKKIPPSKEFNQVRAQALNSQAHLQLAKGNAEAALETWQKAEMLYTQAGDNVGIIGSQINQALALQVLGLYRRSEKILAQVEQQIYKQPDSFLKANGLLNIGNIRRQGKDLERSQEILQISLAISQQVGLPQTQSQALLSLGNTEIAIARRAKELKDTENFKTYTQKALNHYQQAAFIQKSPITRNQALLNQFTLLIETEQYSSLPDLLSQISSSLSQLPPSRISVYAHVNFAQNLIKLEIFGKKISHFPQISQILSTAVEQAKTLADKRAESYALGVFGEFYETTLDWSNAIKFTQSALVIAQAINAPDIAYQWQWQMGKILQTQAEKKLQTRDANAQAIIYYTQAFHTLNNLRNDLVILNPEVQFSFRDSVEPVYRQLVDLLLRSPNPSRENLIQVRSVMEALRLAELDNFFGDACAKPALVNIDNLDPYTAVIYPIILPDRLEVVLKLPGTDNLRHYGNQNVFIEQVDEAARQLRQSLKRRSTSPNQIKKEAQQLYNWLIRPFEAQLESTINREQSNIKTLVFVLDGSLENLPMAALYDGKKYLVERYAVSVTSGLQLLEPKALRRESLSLLIGGATNAPSFKKEGLGNIDNVAVELTGIRQKVKRSQIIENQNFLQQNIRQKINSTPFNIVHLATHGKFSSNPEQTFILDWQERIEVKDLDSLLRLDYQRSAKPIELLVLSACETATGDKRAALGLAGVAIRAGARSTLATLWQINDASTSEFMIKFYQELSNPQTTKAEALRNVQLAFLKEFPSTDFHRPYHWASFILVGNWL
ncbi:CHAT domain-containing protein [Scytonema sp. HK-05]|uniref:CHAT domain-containing protein n=1 Tax=Scytonema sp. HK-05 TaxID=1137095 RepID=UPI001E5EA99C|nr:CHAT domain-containing protein [Scytonema sp. HK-05]